MRKQPHQWEDIVTCHSVDLEATIDALEKQFGTKVQFQIRQGGLIRGAIYPGSRVSPSVINAARTFSQAFVIGLHWKISRAS